MSEIKIHCYGKTVVKDSWNINDFVNVNKLYYVYSGYAVCDGKKLEAGKLYLISDKERHAWQSWSNFEHLYFDFLMTPSFGVSQIVEIDMAEHPEIDALVRAIDGLLSKNRNVGLAKVLLEGILKAMEQVANINCVLDERIAKVVDAICQTGRMHTISELADYAHMDMCYFIKLFKRQVGTTPYKFMNDLRLARAFTMLKDGVSVKETAFECGFLSEAAFSNAFKKRFEVSPVSVKKTV